jgi:hypothetical protein
VWVRGIVKVKHVSSTEDATLIVPLWARAISDAIYKPLADLAEPRPLRRVENKRSIAAGGIGLPLLNCPLVVVAVTRTGWFSLLYINALA